MPVLVLIGHDDYVVGPDYYKSFHFPHQQVIVLSGKHLVLIENPKRPTKPFEVLCTNCPVRADASHCAKHLQQRTAQNNQRHGEVNNQPCYVH